MAQRNLKGPQWPLGSHGNLIPLKEEIPPAVLAARRSLGLDVEMVSPRAPHVLPRAAEPQRVQVVGNNMARGRAKAMVEPRRSMPSLGRCRLVTAAGEVLVRKREMGPWERDSESAKIARGSATLAVEIAGDPSKRDLACRQFGSLVYAPSSTHTKDSLTSLWEENL